MRQLAFEAAATGLLSPELALESARVKGVKRLGVRMGNWLSAIKARAWLVVITETLRTVSQSGCTTDSLLEFRSRQKVSKARLQQVCLRLIARCTGLPSLRYLNDTVC